MKIAFIGQKGIPAKSGGVERHVEELAKRLAKKGHEIFVYARKHYTDGKKLESYEGVRLIYAPSIKTKHFDAISHTFFSTVHALFCSYDIIHYHAIGPSFLSFILRILKPSAKIVSTFHCQDWMHKKWGLFAKLCLKSGAWMAVHAPHRTIAVSKLLQKYCEIEYDKEVDYVPNGVGKAVFKEPQIISEKFGLAENSYILTVARLVPHKGIQYLIEAYKKLKPDKKLVVVGEGSYTDEYVKKLKESAKDNSNIIFTGAQYGKALQELFSNAYIYVHPTENEGLSITVLEAMSYGKCVLASDIPENIEALNDGGFTFVSKDTHDLSLELRRLISDPVLVKLTGDQAAKIVQKHYNWDNVVLDIESLYKSLYGTKMLQKEFFSGMRNA